MHSWLGWWNLSSYYMLLAGWCLKYLYFLISWLIVISIGLTVYWSCYELYVWVCNIGIMLHQMGWKRVKLAFSWYFNRAMLAPALVPSVLLGVNLCWELSSYSHSKPASLSAYKLVLKLPPALDERTCRMIISRMGNSRLECIIHTEMLWQFWISVDLILTNKARIREIGPVIRIKIIQRLNWTFKALVSLSQSQLN